MARCSQCNKFASYDDPEADVSIDIADATLTISVEGALKSQCCSVEVKHASLSHEVDLATLHKCPNADLIGREVNGEEVEDTYEEETNDLEGYSRMQTKDRHGKPIKNMRYARAYYGFTGTVEVKHQPCAEIIEVTIGEGDLEEQASGWDEV